MAPTIERDPEYWGPDRMTFEDEEQAFLDRVYPEQAEEAEEKQP